MCHQTYLSLDVFVAAAFGTDIIELSMFYTHNLKHKVPKKKFRCSTDLSTYDYQVKKQTNKQKYGRWNFLKLKYIFEHIGLYGLNIGYYIVNSVLGIESYIQVAWVEW